MTRSHAIVVVGARAPEAASLEALLVRLPRRLALPVAVVARTHEAALRLAAPLPVEEVDDKDPAIPGRIHLAPPDYHLLVDDCGFALSTEAPVCDARPSIDVLFRSTAEVHGARAIGILLGAEGRDGIDGLAAIAAHGGVALAEAGVVRGVPETASVRRLAPAQMAELVVVLSGPGGAP